MKLLKKMGTTELRNVSLCVALAVASVLPAQAAPSANELAPLASSTTAAKAPTSATSAVDTPQGILASGQIHKRTTPAISLANEPELPFFFKSWVFALLTVLIVVAIKRPWKALSVKSSERRASRAAGMIAPLVRS